MADHDHAATHALGKANEIEAAAAQLRDRAWGRRDIGAVDKLDRVDQDHGRARTARLLNDAGDVPLAHDEQTLAQLGGAPRLHDGLEPLGAQTHLLRTLFARRIEGSPSACRDRCSYLHQQRALSDAWIATEEHDRARHDTAAEDAVELADPRRDARNGRLGNAAEGDRLADARAREFISVGAIGGRTPDRRGTRLRRLDLHRELFKAVPRAAVWALAHPFRVVRAALAAEELCAHLRHGARV